MIEEIEKRTGLKVEEMNAIEKETFFDMLDNVQKTQLSPEKLRDYIIAMREAVEAQIVKEKTFIRVFIFKFDNPNLVRLQARLQNYILLEAFLSSHEKAKAQLDSMISNVTGKK